MYHGGRVIRDRVVRGAPPSIKLFNHLKGLCSKCFGNSASPNNPVGRIIESRMLFALAYFWLPFP